MSAAIVFALLSSLQQHPFDPPILEQKPVARWDFIETTAGWNAVNDCSVAAAPNGMIVTSTGADPYVIGPPIELSGQLIARVVLTSSTGGGGQFYWATATEPMSERTMAPFRVPKNRVIEIDVPLGDVANMQRLRIDPGSSPGSIRIESIELLAITRHPVRIESIRQENAVVRATARAGGPAFDVIASCPPRPFAEIELPFVAGGGAPPLVRHVHRWAPSLAGSYGARHYAGITLRRAVDGTGFRIDRGAATIAAIWPLAIRDGRAVRFESVVPTARGWKLEGDGVRAELKVHGVGTVRVELRSDSPIEGPVVRTPTAHDAAILPGLEYLTKGESSSSDRDVETAARLRFRPDPRLVTAPMMAVSSADGHVVTVRWSDSSLAPTFATPDIVDGHAGARMALVGTEIRADIWVVEGELEQALVALLVDRPPIPERPRTDALQRALALAALDGPLRGEQPGWGHCAEPKWGRALYADMASAVWRLRGEIPANPSQLVPGGAHIRDDAIWFVCGQAERWLQLRRAEAERLMRDQLADGSFRYRGEYLRGHFEDTSSGLCGQRALRLLEFARVTGDSKSRDAGLRALEFCKRFRTPRGAQTWELSLHTPDILAAGHLVRASMIAADLTKDPTWIHHALTWACRGLPFIYLWGDRPVMRYATVPVFGATNWRAPVWFGLPVQWCGVNYAHALTLLDRRNGAWHELAVGIHACAEQMQYPDGPLVGCLPDLFALDGQVRAGPSINPCAILSLGRALDGRPHNVEALTLNGRTVAGPFPMRRGDGDEVLVESTAGTQYQLVIDGVRTLSVRGTGRDVVRLN